MHNRSSEMKVEGSVNFKSREFKRWKNPKIDNRPGRSEKECHPRISSSKVHRKARIKPTQTHDLWHISSLGAIQGWSPTYARATIHRPRDYYVQTDKDRQTDRQIIRPFPQRWKRCERRREERTQSMIIAPWCCIRQLSPPRLSLRLSTTVSAE